MSLFQSTVLKKHINALDTATVDAAYERFVAHFHDKGIQENIRNAKEEQYQGEFLIDLFVRVLGYVKNPTPNFNLTTELKNVKDSKKADGAIIDGDRVLAVIELKGTAVTDLGKIEVQAFGYKNNQPGCVFVITSNFEKMRFYIDNAVDFEEFNLFALSRERFDVLWLCLSADSLLRLLPKQLKDESLSREEVVTKELYKDYALFRTEVYRDIVAGNPQVDKLTLFKVTQKLLDRFLFIFFAEDRLLLPPNSIRAIVQQWEDLRDKYDEYQPLYERFKKYFGYMNTGHKGQKHDIFAYNGGLFKPDAVLDSIVIDDDLLHKHTFKLSNYDFVSEVSVNILGHIFEHSLNEIEEIQAEIEGQTVDKGTSKRKKDGVFYTPKYITKYIVDNTVGKLCEEKKTALGIDDADYDRGRKGRQKETIKKLAKTLDDYRAWLLQLTICDPACGSGAFLNQALEFLIAEHAYVDELHAKLFGDAMVLSEVENSILENNLFGVDINNESVEIAKLSLWLRTAQKGRKLTSLNNNIKCGNSLIDDPAVAGDKAFDWEKEFPQVFQEKTKKAFHITTALHDSRTSQRMIDYKVRKKRDLGTNPYPNYTKLTAEEEVLITQIVAEIVKEDKLNIPAYNICGDHMHLLLVCEEEEQSRIVQKIKAKTARAVNIAKGITIPVAPATLTTREHAPLASQDKKTLLSREHAPLASKKHNSLWTQKYGCNPIRSDKQLHNTINYIQNNREKHELPENKDLQSLITQLTCTIEQAFAPEYSGGFDVVIGNPPYGAKIDSQQTNHISNKFNASLSGEIDTYIIFYFSSISILKKNGILGFITPDTWLTISKASGLRNYLLNNVEIIDVYDRYKPFVDAKDTRCHTLILRNQKSTSLINVKVVNSKSEVVKSFELPSSVLKLNQEWNIYTSNEEREIFNKMKKNSVKLEDLFNLKYGLRTGNNSKYLTNNISESLTGIKIARGSNIENYYFNWSPEYLITKEGLPDSYFDESLINSPKIIIQYVRTNSTNPRARWLESTIIEEDNFVPLNSTSFVYLKDNSYSLKYLLPLISSYLLNFYYKAHYTDVNVKPLYLAQLPIPIVDELKQQLFIEKADIMIKLNKELKSIVFSFNSLVQSKFPIEKLTNKLQSWHELDFKGFLKELKKAKVHLTLSEEAEWMGYFNEQKQKATALQQEIDRVDREIDGMVYGLYGLDEAEIAIVEGS
ncbi:MAG: N-6 DNA methylase [Flavobacteriaceae bacterium]